MNDLRVDRLTLRLGSMSEADGRRLAELVVANLAAVDLPGGPRALERLRLQVTPRPGESIDRIARRIAIELAATLARMP
jgi:hypothetical protein